MPSEIVLKCAKALAKNKLNVAFAESATAGRMCSEFSLSPESGNILRGGISCYEVFVKEQILKVPHQLIETCTAESKEVTQALVKSAARLFNSKVTVAVTGLTTPGGSEGPDKPVGTMFIGIKISGQEHVHKEVFTGNPEEIVLKAIDKAAVLIIEMIDKK